MAEARRDAVDELQIPHRLALAGAPYRARHRFGEREAGVEKPHGAVLVGSADPAPDALGEPSPRGGVAVARDEALSGAVGEAEACEEVAPRLVAHVVRAEGDPGDDDVVDETGETHPGPGGWSEEHGAGIGPERVEAAPETCAPHLDEGSGTRSASSRARS